MNAKEIKRRIYEYDFAIHELVLFLDSHPVNQRAMELLSEYRRRRAECVSELEEQCGNYIVTADDVPASGCWEWLKGPWPWEKSFAEV